MTNTAYIGYFRVSTAKQGVSGLGLEAQQMAVHGFVNASKGTLAGEFTEVESGTRRDRPQLTAALALCKKRGATLVIARLDRLARSVAFVSTLLDSGVRFVAVDMPEADRAFLQIASVFAEWEARKVSERTKAALAAAKARGVKFGWACPERRSGHAKASAKGAKTNRASAALFAQNVLPLVREIRAAGVGSLEGVAAALNARGVPTARGGRWHASTVSRLTTYAA